jgi:hypothetical protein
MEVQSLAHSERSGIGEPTEALASAAETYEFLLGMQNGDAVGFEWICKGSAKMIFNIARRMTLSKEDAVRFRLHCKGSSDSRAQEIPS